MADDIPQRSDEDLVREALAGESAAFGALVQRHFGAVFAVALARLRDFDAAEDLTQEVFLRAQIHLRQLGIADRFPAWVTRIARNLAIDWQRRGQSASRLLPMVPLGPNTEHVPDPTDKGAREAMLAEETSGAVRDAILDLPADLREVVLLQVAEDLTQEEIAERLGIHQATVSRRLQRALDALRGTLRPLLREAAPALRPPTRAVARSLMIATAVGAMSATAKASLAAAAPAGQIQQATAAVQAGVAGAAGIFGLLRSLPALIAGGVQMLGTAKGLTVAGAAAVAAIAGGTYHFARTEDTPRQAPPPPVPARSVGGFLDTAATREIAVKIGQPVDLIIPVGDAVRLIHQIDGESEPRHTVALGSDGLSVLMQARANDPARPGWEREWQMAMTLSAERSWNLATEPFFALRWSHDGDQLSVRAVVEAPPSEFAVRVTDLVTRDPRASDPDHVAWLQERDALLREYHPWLFDEDETDSSPAPVNALSASSMPDHEGVFARGSDGSLIELVPIPTETLDRLQRDEVSLAVMGDEFDLPLVPSDPRLLVQQPRSWYEDPGYGPGNGYDIAQLDRDERSPNLRPEYRDVPGVPGLMAIRLDTPAVGDFLIVARGNFTQGEAELWMARLAGSESAEQTGDSSASALPNEPGAYVQGDDGEWIQLWQIAPSTMLRIWESAFEGEDVSSRFDAMDLPTIPRVGELIVVAPDLVHGWDETFQGGWFRLSDIRNPERFESIINPDRFATPGEELEPGSGRWRVTFSPPAEDFDLFNFAWVHEGGEGPLRMWLAWLEGHESAVQTEDSSASAPPDEPGAYAQGDAGEWIQLWQIAPSTMQRIWEGARQGEDVSARFDAMDLPTIPRVDQMVVVAPDLTVSWDETIQGGSFRVADMEADRFEGSVEALSDEPGRWRVTFPRPDGDAFTVGWVHQTQGPQRMWLARLAGNAVSGPSATVAEIESTSQALFDALMADDFSRAENLFASREELLGAMRRYAEAQGRPFSEGQARLAERIIAGRAEAFDYAQEQIRGLANDSQDTAAEAPEFSPSEANLDWMIDDVVFRVQFDGDELFIRLGRLIRVDGAWRLTSGPEVWASPGPPEEPLYRW